MKNLFLLILLISASFAASSQQYGWIDISANMPELVGFTDIQFIGDEGWITGGNGKIYYTPDGGATFSIQQLPAGSGITSSVFMKSATEGYAVTFSGKILHFINNEWTTLHEPGGTFYSVDFPPTLDVGYTCGNNGKIWAFDDQSITDISPPGVSSDLQSICFPKNASEGRVCGETLISRYFNNTWANLQFYDATLFYNSIFFVNDTLGWACGIHGTIIKTIDGIYWLIQTTNTTKSFNDVFFLNSQEGWAVGTEVILHSTDGGITWTKELESYTPGKILTGIYFISPNKGYIAGNNTVLKYGEVSGIADDILDELTFEVYPNPCRNKFVVSSSQLVVEAGMIEVYDISGRNMIKRNIPAGTETSIIDVSGLPAGVYFIKLQTEDAVGVRKIIIK